MKRLHRLIAPGLLLVPLATRAQSPETPFTASGAFIALSVADAAASARWYQEKLGLRIVLQPPKTSEATAIILEGGGLLVELVQHEKARPLSAAAPGVTASYQVHGYFKTGLIVDDFDRTIAALRARGVTIAFGPYPKSATQRANVIIGDNAGNLIRFFGK